jgi:hypothetical protein
MVLLSHAMPSVYLACRAALTSRSESIHAGHAGRERARLAVLDGDDEIGQALERPELVNRQRFGHVRPRSARPIAE